MQTEQLAFTPVITPRTLEGVLKSLGNGERPELARKTQELKLLLSLVVEQFFVPVASLSSNHKFWAWFRNSSAAFLPYRIFLNFELVSLFDPGEIFEAYRSTLSRITESSFPFLLQWKIQPERMSRVLAGYLQVAGSLLALKPGGTQIPRQGSPEAAAFFSLWVEDATRFDFGLTAIFLALEKAIPIPSAATMKLLVAASEKELGHFSDSSHVLRELFRGNTAALDALPRPMQSRLEKQKSLHLRARKAGRGKHLQSPAGQVTSVRTGTTRQEELSWLERRPDLVREFGGQWIVVEKDELIASDKEYESARARAVGKGIAHPFIIFVPPSEDEAFMGL